MRVRVSLGLSVSAGTVLVPTHEELKNLDMPAMTVVFAVPDKSTLGKLKQGEQSEFVAERVKGKLTVTEVK